MITLIVQTAAVKLPEGSTRDLFRFSFQPFPLQLLPQPKHDAIAEYSQKGLTRYEESTPASQKFPQRSPAKKEQNGESYHFVAL
ncbi:unnamed protein product [Lasius platythorax]|uniref:Uncharacterized protein n=1 Tax=Lasius platythorax TaxID=488582 RepID=A0AAV2NFH0_9HYME